MAEPNLTRLGTRTEGRPEKAAYDGRYRSCDGAHARRPLILLGVIVATSGIFFSPSW
jgi:hypothetical protein